MTFRYHPASDTFPMMNSDRYSELVIDMAKQGQLEPIALCDGMILDGRNRYKACLELGIEPVTREYAGDPWAYVWSLNGERRDLVAEQRYLIWKECHEKSDAFQAERARIREEANRKRSEAAITGKTQCLTTLSDRNVGQQVRASASKTNPGAVARGDRLAKERPDLAEKVRKGEVKPAEAHRQMKRDEVTQKTSELPTGKYLVIYADPPWQYRDGRTGDLVTATGALYHYSTMSISELKALPINNLAADDSVLFLWATAPLIEDALELAKAWGFTYKAQFVWDKVRHNMGNYNSVRHELLLIATRGSCTPQIVKLFDSVQVIEKTKEHSRKPERFREIIDTLYPRGPRIELFRRGGAPDKWHVWGNEVNGV